MSGGGNGGPPNKWLALKIDGLTGDQIAKTLSDAASEGFYQTPVVTTATDGTFVQVAGYGSGNQT